MAAKPTVKFMGRSGGVVHVITTKSEDLKHSNCSSLKKGHEDGVWKGKGMSPEAALSLAGCSRCNTHEVAEVERRARMTPAQKRAETKAKRDATMDRLRTRSRSADRSSKARERVESKSEQSELRKRRGPKGGDPTAKMKADVEEHAKIATANGWVAKAWESGVNEWTCEATRNGETLKLIYRDGRTVWSRVVLASGVEVRLRNSSNWRKHATGISKINPDYSPRQHQGKRAAKSEVINDSAPRRLPFDLETDDEDIIVESLLGKTITWRNSVSNHLDSAVVPMRSRNVRITSHPKSDRLMISFHEYQGKHKMGDEVREMLGGERTVYLDKILKAR